MFSKVFSSSKLRSSVKSSIAFLNLPLCHQPVGYALVFMNHGESVRQPLQALRMADEEVAARDQAFGETLHQPLLLLLVEIDHHVAAEDGVEVAQPVVVLQVVVVEGHQPLDLL